MAIDGGSGRASIRISNPGEGSNTEIAGALQAARSGQSGGRRRQEARRDDEAGDDEETGRNSQDQRAPGLDVDGAERFLGVRVIVVAVRLAMIVRSVRLAGQVAGMVQATVRRRVLELVGTGLVARL